MPGRVPARQRDAVAPVGIDLVELDQRSEASCRPEPGLVVADRALNGALLARRARRARGGVKGVVAAQLNEPAVPRDLFALAARDRGAQVVVDALAGNAAQ